MDCFLTRNINKSDPRNKVQERSAVAPEEKPSVRSMYSPVDRQHQSEIQILSNWIEFDRPAKVQGIAYY
jgi:hypothetical protein